MIYLDSDTYHTAKIIQTTRYGPAFCGLHSAIPISDSKESKFQNLG